MSEPLQFETEFVDHTLRTWAEITEQKLRAALEKRGVGVTDALAQSLAFRVLQASGRNKGGYQLMFHEYGRMIDMGAGRGSGLQSKARRDDKAAKLNANIRKPKKWYAKTFYGEIGSLVAALSRNYADYAAQRITAQNTTAQ